MNIQMHKIHKSLLQNRLLFYFLSMYFFHRIFISLTTSCANVWGCVKYSVTICELDVDVDVDEMCERRHVASLPASSILQ